jgi:hypothetical protein
LTVGDYTDTYIISVIQSGGAGGGETLAVKPPADPGKGYTPHIMDGTSDEGGWFTAEAWYYGVYQEAEWQRDGAFRLEDILVDDDYTGLTVTPLDPQYEGMFKIGNHAYSNKPSILYSVVPDKDVVAQQHIDDPESLFPITTMLRLTKGGKSVDIKVTMLYKYAMIIWWE